MTMLTRAAEAVSAVLLWLIFITLALELLSRNFLSHSLAGSWEVAAFMMGAMFFLGLAPALGAGSHVRVVMLSRMLTGTVGKLVEAMVLTVALAVSAYAARALINLALSSYSRESLSWELSIPLAIPQAVVALGMSLFALSFLARLVLLLLGDPFVEETDKA